MANIDPERDAHKAWLGLVQPVGLVVSPPALTKAGIVLDRNVIEVQQALQAIVTQSAEDDDTCGPALLEVPRFVSEVLGWSPADLAGAPDGPPLPDSLAVPLPDHGEILRPTYAAVDEMDGGKVLMLVLVVDRGVKLDKLPSDDGHIGWHTSPQARFERLLRDTKVSAGMLLNGDELRLVYAPQGESSGYMSFPVAEMCTVQGRPLLAAVHMLLSEHRVFGAPDTQRLLDLLAESRKYQNEVSTKLASQVLSALWELLHGFQAADEAARGALLLDLPREDPQQIYGGLLTVIMRLVFLLYAEDQGLMPDDPVYARNYAIGGLYERLREDAGRYPDTMDQRFGAYAWLLSTFRMVFDGGAHGAFKLPTRHGQLFNPDEYPFLEGRPVSARIIGVPLEVPRVSDGVIWRVLEDLLVLDGERLSYRALDVEQIGSVYESMMGFDVRVLPGRAIAVRPKNIVFDIDALLKVEPGKREAWLKEHAECELTDKGKKALKEARIVEDVVVALGARVAVQTPRPLAPGALFLQPSAERRRSGSHYTPRELTEPIVRTTLRPVLEALGPKATPEQILELKVCDPAMGSGAFLVEACRQLAVALVAAWETHSSMPTLPPDEPPYLHARRLVAQRCLYGVDKNPFAVSLAKLSLWLVTLAKDHAFTFLDHALKHGDSLVGLTKNQIGAFDWDPPEIIDSGTLFQRLTVDIRTAAGWRSKIQALGEGDYDARRGAWIEGEEIIRDARLIGDLCVAAYFRSDKHKDREGHRLEYRYLLDTWKAGGDQRPIEEIVHKLRSGYRPVVPFHWEIEFPEVSGRGNPGFDAMISNPPFLGGTLIGGVLGLVLHDWLIDRYAPATGLADIVAFFLRHCFSSLRRGGTLGLIATNTIAQGSTRSTGLEAVLAAEGSIYEARKRYKWSGGAAVTTSVVHLGKNVATQSATLDGVPVTRVSSYLLPGSVDRTPRALAMNRGRCYRGTKIWGAGFVFEKNPSKGSSSLDDYSRLLASNPKNAEVISPYIGGEEFNEDPLLAPVRFVIDFENRTKEAAQAWPELFALVEERVRPVRATNEQRNRRDEWWRHANRVEAADPYFRANGRLLAATAVSKYLAYGFVADGTIVSDSMVLVLRHSYGAFCVVQSRLHEVWARLLGSTFEDRLRYTTICFDTFPLPRDIDGDVLARVGEAYYRFRADLMVRNDEGLTKTYNRFHDREEHAPDILELRRLHAAMDRALLDAYDWKDVPTECDFFLDYEIDEEAWGNRKKPWRYRWPDAVYDDVLARLLVLNQQRYEEEAAAGLHSDKKRTAPAVAATPVTKPSKQPAKPRKSAEGRPAKRGKRVTAKNPTMFARPEEDNA